MATDSKAFPLVVRNWSDLSSLIEHFSRFSAHDWLFRGVTDETHGLTAKIGREKTRALKESKRIPYRAADEAALFKMFKAQALSHTQRAPVTQLEWLALAQHFGVPTRLLDWTESLLVAAWFAVEKSGVKQDKRNSAIWVTRGVRHISEDSKQDPLKITDPCVYRPAHVSTRIAAQASVLMVCPGPTKEAKLKFVRKIVVERSAEFTIKKRLNACGVNRRLLFPDLQGLAEHLAWLHKHDYLAGYREHGDDIPGTPDSEGQSWL